MLSRSPPIWFTAFCLPTNAFFLKSTLKNRNKTSRAFHPKKQCVLLRQLGWGHRFATSAMCFPRGIICLEPWCSREFLGKSECDIVNTHGRELAFPWYNIRDEEIEFESKSVQLSRRISCRNGDKWWCLWWWWGCEKLPKSTRIHKTRHSVSWLPFRGRTQKVPG